MIPAWWARLWGIAVLAHLIGNPNFGELVPEMSVLGVTAALAALAAGGLVLRPQSRWMQLTVTGLIVVIAWLEAPILGNHWQLAALVSGAAMVAIASRREPGWFGSVAAWMLLGFYGWAAFAKLNSAFFDPGVSCGLHFTNQALGSWGLPTIATESALAWGPIIGAALVELSIPVLLLIRRTRMVGVLVGMTFHGLISLDFDQHFFDFTAVLIPLFLLFAPHLGGRIGDRIRHDLLRPMVLVAGGVALAGLLPAGPVTVLAVRYGAFVLWVPYLAWVVATGFRQARGSLVEELRRPVGVVALAFIGVVVAIGALPYLEVRTATSWNMYANLSTAEGRSNHLVVRTTAPLTNSTPEFVSVVESTDPMLQLYADRGFRVAENQLLHYLADRPTRVVTYERGGEIRSGSGAELGRQLGLFQEKLLFFRSVDTQQLSRCQATWLPAG